MKRKKPHRKRMIGKIEEINSKLYQQSYILEGERCSFMLALLALTAYITQIDGDPGMQKQNYVRHFVAAYYSPDKAQQCQTLFSRIMAKCLEYDPLTRAVKIEDCASFIASFTSVEERLAVVDFLILVAKAGAEVTPLEVMAATGVATWLGVGPVAEPKIQELKATLPNTDF